MTRVPPEYQVRRKGDPAPCKQCHGGRCRLCSWGMVWEPSWATDGSNRAGTITQKPCPHGCERPAERPAAYYILNAQSTLTVSS